MPSISARRSRSSQSFQFNGSGLPEHTTYLRARQRQTRALGVDVVGLRRKSLTVSKRPARQQLAALTRFEKLRLVLTTRDGMGDSDIPPCEQEP